MPWTVDGMCRPDSGTPGWLVERSLGVGLRLQLVCQPSCGRAPGWQGCAGPAGYRNGFGTARYEIFARQLGKRRKKLLTLILLVRQL